MENNITRGYDAHPKLKIAYICLCHTDPQFVARTARVLRYHGDGFFIHVDRKTNIAPFVAECMGLDHVHFVENRIDNYWGGFHAVIATVRTIQLALSYGNYDRFILLQGQDYPLVSPKEIHDFFEANTEVEFCKAKDISRSKQKKDYMKCCGFWIMDCRPRFPLKLFRSFLHRLNLLGIPYRSAIFRSRKETWTIYHGWAQFALTGACVQHILRVYEENRAYNSYMKHRFPPDEIYFHTIIHNSPFKEKVSPYVVVNHSGEATQLNLTYFEYPAQVMVFTEKEDYHWLKNTGCLFVRKVNSGSVDLLNEIDAHIESFDSPSSI